MSTSKNSDLKPNSAIPISNFGALFSLNPSNAVTILRNSNSFDASCRIERAFETPPALANLIANSSVITGDFEIVSGFSNQNSVLQSIPDPDSSNKGSSEIVTDISNQNSVLQLTSDCDLSIVKTEVETVENFENSLCNSNIDHNSSQTRTLSTVTQNTEIPKLSTLTQNTEIHKVGYEGLPKHNEHHTPNPLIPACVTPGQVQDPCLSAKSANLKSVFKPVQQVNATAKSVIRNAEDSSNKGSSEIVTDISDQNSVLQLTSDCDLSIVKTEIETVENFENNPFNSDIDHNSSQTRTLSTVTQNTKIQRVGNEGHPSHNKHLNNPDTANLLIPVCAAPGQVQGPYFSAKSANLKSVLKPVQQVNATEKSVVRNAEDSKGNSASYQGVRNSDPRNQNVVVSDEVTKNLELLKRYFVGNKCLICGFVSKRLRSGHRHMVVHMTVKPYQCKQCPKAFATERRLASHYLSHTNKSMSSKFTCSTCGKCFERQSYLKSHEDRHVPVVRHTCEICHKGFSRMQQLRRHARTHTGEKPFVCSVCGDSFVKSCSFKKHTNIHTKEIAYTCHVCQKVFYSSNYFNVHMRAHGQGDVFQCDVCNATFNFKSNLAQHKLTHSENRSHKCNECGKTFKLPHHLRQHLQTHKSGSASSTKRNTPKPKRVRYDYSDDEDFVLPDVKDVKNFPIIKEEN